MKKCGKLEIKEEEKNIEKNEKDNFVDFDCSYFV